MNLDLTYIRKVFLLLLFGMFLWRCSGYNSESIPDSVRDLENLTIYPGDAQPPFEISFKQEISFGSAGELPIGRMGGFSVDDSGRVYITDFERQALFVFEPNGNVITQIGRKGNGPGEFMAGPFPYIISNQLYAFDIMSLRLSIFSTDSFELIKTLNLNPVNQSHFEELDDTHVRQIYPRDDGKFLVSFAQFNRTPPTVAGEKIDHFYLRYYLMENNVRIIPDMVFRLKQQPYLTGKVDNRIQMATFQFLEKPLVTVSENGSIYLAMSDKFLIKKYSSEGEYLNAFYYSYEKIRMEKAEALSTLIKNVPKEIAGEHFEEIIEFRKEIVNQNKLPLNWPVLENMLIDDENRLWVSTIVEDFEIYEWWVLKETGEIITKFEWPRAEPIEEVRNSNIYTRKMDEETGLQQVARYRFEINEKLEQ